MGKSEAEKHWGNVKRYFKEAFKSNIDVIAHHNKIKKIHRKRNVQIPIVEQNKIKADFDRIDSYKDLTYNYIHYLQNETPEGNKYYIQKLKENIKDHYTSTSVVIVNQIVALEIDVHEGAGIGNQIAATEDADMELKCEYQGCDDIGNQFVDSAVDVLVKVDTDHQLISSPADNFEGAISVLPVEPPSGIWTEEIPPNIVDTQVLPCASFIAKEKVVDEKIRDSISNMEINMEVKCEYPGCGEKICIIYPHTQKLWCEKHVDDQLSDFAAPYHDLISVIGNPLDASPAGAHEDADIGNQFVDSAVDALVEVDQKFVDVSVDANVETVACNQHVPHSDDGIDIVSFAKGPISFSGQGIIVPDLRSNVTSSLRSTSRVAALCVKSRKDELSNKRKRNLPPREMEGQPKLKTLCTTNSSGNCMHNLSMGARTRLGFVQGLRQAL
jgi:hypothetical protein